MHRRRVYLAFGYFAVDREETGALSVEVAKERVRQSAERLSFSGWVREDPKEALVTAFAVGFSAGRRPSSEGGARALAGAILSLLGGEKG